MAFRTADFSHLAKFNSASSSEFLDFYEDFVDSEILKSSKRKPGRTFAPSSFRCDRRSWFRLRGVEPDGAKVPDRALNFSAEVGTACHKMIQTNLKKSLGTRWIPVNQYIQDSSYTCIPSDDGLETFISISDPPVKFACDGIIYWNNVQTLIEIKSTEYSTWNDLTDPKDEHIDQVKFYAYLLRLHKALVIYIDRQYGELKCFEVDITSKDYEYIESKIHHVLDCVDKQIAPDPLPKGDKWCSRSMCQYYDKCGEYGR